MSRRGGILRRWPTITDEARPQRCVELREEAAPNLRSVALRAGVRAPCVTRGAHLGAASAGRAFLFSSATCHACNAHSGRRFSALTLDRPVSLLGEKMRNPATPRRLSAARARILEVAGARFYQDGIRAVGIDAIIEEADVARMTFYKHFPSKDQLVLEYLQGRDRQWWEWVEAALEKYGPDDADRPLVIFDALEQRLQRPFRRGCAFVNAMADLADPDHPAHRFALGHKRAVEDFVRGLCRELGHADADGLAERLVLLLEGAMVRAHRTGIARPARTAREIAARLLAEAPRRGVSAPATKVRRPSNQKRRGPPPARAGSPRKPLT